MFRKPVQRLWCFRAALDDLVETAEQNAEAMGGHAGRGRSSRRFDRALSEIAEVQTVDGADGGQISRIWRAYLADHNNARSEPYLSAEEVAAMLRSRPVQSRAQLTRLRRRFALANHPDRLPEPMRSWAAANMAAVNAMIDEALQHTSA